MKRDEPTSLFYSPFVRDSSRFAPITLTFPWQSSIWPMNRMLRHFSKLVSLQRTHRRVLGEGRRGNTVKKNKNWCRGGNWTERLSVRFRVANCCVIGTKCTNPDNRTCAKSVPPSSSRTHFRALTSAINRSPWSFEKGRLLPSLRCVTWSVLVDFGGRPFCYVFFHSR
jgi:hypothetical protein